MFVSATFHGPEAVTSAAVPSSAIVHLHDRDWVYVPLEGKLFRRLEVVGGHMLPGQMQEVSGVAPGQSVVLNALALQADARTASTAPALSKVTEPIKGGHR